MKMIQWVLAVLLAMVMFAAGLSKVVSSDFRETSSDAYWGLPSWFFILVGIAEIVIAIDLVWPRFRVLGGVGLFVVMVGAAVFNFSAVEFDGNSANSVIPLNIILALLGLLVAWLAAGRPRDLKTLSETARKQIVGQVEDLGDTAKGAVS